MSSGAAEAMSPELSEFELRLRNQLNRPTKLHIAVIPPNSSISQAAVSRWLPLFLRGCVPNPAKLWRIHRC